MYGPGMSAQIEDYVSKCGICLENRSSYQKENIILSTISELPWQVVGADLFQWSGSNYLLVVDYMLKFFEVAKLENSTSSTVIHNMKLFFSRHGIPREVRSDNGPCYSSAEFKKFSKDRGFKHTTSSSYSSNSNGLEEIYVKIVKQILTKSKAENKDPYLSILNYRNTPIDDLGSPAQLLMNRRLRSILPITQILFKPKVIGRKRVHKRLSKKQCKQKYFYDKRSRNLSQLKSGNTILVQRENTWEPGVITDHASTPRSYHVRTERGGYRRNRKHLMKTKEIPIRSNDRLEDDYNKAWMIAHNGTNENHFSSETKPNVTRYGRMVKTPARFKDYVM